MIRQIWLLLFFINLYGCESHFFVSDEGDMLIEGRQLVAVWNGSEWSMTLAEGEQLFKTENINDDSILEIFTVSFEGEDVLVRVYQLPLHGNDHKYIRMQNKLSFLGSYEKPLQNMDIRDLDEDGFQEIVIRKYTHSPFGSVNLPGKITWFDVYRLDPELRLANQKYLDLYNNKKDEICYEVSRLENEISQHAKNINTGGLHALKVRDAKTQIETYKIWLNEIHKMQMDTGIVPSGCP